MVNYLQWTLSVLVGPSVHPSLHRENYSLQVGFAFLLTDPSVTTLELGILHSNCGSMNMESTSCITQKHANQMQWVSQCWDGLLRHSWRSAMLQNHCRHQTREPSVSPWDESIGQRTKQWRPEWPHLSWPPLTHWGTLYFLFQQLWALQG